MKIKNLSLTLNNIKVYTILLVIIGHVLAIYTHLSLFPHIGSKVTGLLYNLIYSFHMPLFIFVSGAVYAICRDKGKYSTWSELIKIKSKRILVPYITFCLIILFPTLKVLGVYDKTLFQWLYDAFLGLNVRHLWYLMVLFEMFIVTYFIESLRKNFNHYIILLISLCVAILAYNINVPQILQVNMLLKFYIYFLLGFYVGRSKINICCNLWCCIIFAIIGLIGNYIMYQLPTILYSFVTIITAICLLVVAYSICQLNNIGSNTKIYNVLKKDGMGIYLFHVIFIYIFFYFDLFADCGIYIQIISATLTSLLLSIAATRLVRISRLGFLIGEF